MTREERKSARVLARTLFSSAWLSVFATLGVRSQWTCCEIFNNKNTNGGKCLTTKISPHPHSSCARCEQKLLNGESRGVDLSNCKNFCVILLLGVLCFIVEPLKMMRCQRGELKTEKHARQMHACKHTLGAVFFPELAKTECNSSRSFSWWRAARFARCGMFARNKEMMPTRERETGGRRGFL